MPDEKKQDWESAALARVSARVEAVTTATEAAAPDAEGVGGDAAKTREDFGWEETVLRNLRKRLLDDRGAG